MRRRRTDSSTNDCETAIRPGEESRKCEGVAPEQERPIDSKLFLFLTCFFAAALACQRFFNALLFARLQVERVTLHFLDNVFLLHLAFEAAQSVFEGFALLNSDFRQTLHTPKLVLFGPCSYCKVSKAKSSAKWEFW
jgi:hypothetical protein